MVSKEKMQEVYERLKTPVKLGAVIKEENGVLCDSPTIFSIEASPNELLCNEGTQAIVVRLSFLLLSFVTE